MAPRSTSSRRRPRTRPGHARSGSRARSHCRFVPPTHPLHTTFTNIFGASISQATMRPNPKQEAEASSAAPGNLVQFGSTPRHPSTRRALARRPRPGARSHCHSINRGTEGVSESAMKWMSGSTERQCGRAPTAPTSPARKHC
jgi:hypothetical protein